MLIHFDYEGREVYSTVTPTTYTKVIMKQLIFKKCFGRLLYVIPFHNQVFFQCIAAVTDFYIPLTDYV